MDTGIFWVDKIVDITEEIEAYDVFTRNCKLPHETDGLKLLQNYSIDGCEFECAILESVSICKCIPWYYPNNLRYVPVIFGGNKTKILPGQLVALVWLWTVGQQSQRPPRPRWWEGECWAP